MPRLRRFDPDEELLVLEYLDAVQPLDSLVSSHSRLGTACATELGRALALLHDSELPAGPGRAAPTPWMVAVARPSPEILSELSSASIQVVRIVQQTPGLGDLLSGLSPPHGPAAPIHGDVRWDNCLVRPRTDLRDVERIFLVDWELAGHGDPCWDVAGVFCEHLSSWIRSLPLVPSLSLDDSLRLAACPLDEIRPRIAAFWGAYGRSRRMAETDPAFLLRSMQLAGLRLVQAAIEAGQASPRLTTSMVHSLQLAENILHDPRAAARALLGLPVA